jgi:hypothetical protein
MAVDGSRSVDLDPAAVNELGFRRLGLKARGGV